LKESHRDIKINVKKRYVVNGKEYHSLEEMPADIRQVYETAIVSKGVLSRMRRLPQGKL
jgi:hypothetical protein